MLAMYKRRSPSEHMTCVAAYNSLGFSTAVLGEDRANSAGKRAMRLGQEVVCSPQIPPAMMALYPERGYGGLCPLWKNWPI